MSEIYPQVGAFFDYVRHELMHSCYTWSGYYIPHLPPAQDEYFGYDYTHKYFHLPYYPEPGAANPEGAFSQLDYNNIINSLKKGQPMAQIITQAKGPERRIVLKAANGTEWDSLCKVFGKDPNKVEEII